MRDARWCSRLCGWLTLGVAAIPATGRAAEPAAGQPAIYAAAEAAAARGSTEKTKMLGFGIIKTAFTEVPRDGAILVGFDLGIGKFLNIDTIYAIRPVYRAADGEASYGEHGLFKDKRGPGKQVTKSKVTHTVRLRARPGYAVGGVTLRTGLNINGMAAIFMRIDGTALDPDRSYVSEWVGDRTGGSEATISGVGAPIIGVFGNKDAEHVMALGLVCMEQPEPPAAIQPQRPPPAAAPPRPAGPPAPPQPAAPRPEERANPVPAEPIQRVLDKYIDHANHFSFTIPDGWKRMSRTERDLIDSVLKQRGLDDLVKYDAGLRPNSTTLGTYPYVLIQIINVQTAGMTHQQIQDHLNLGLDAPLKIVEGKFSDVIRELSAGQPVLDRSRNRIAVRMQSDVMMVGKVEGLSMCHIGSDAVVSVHCYAKTESFERYLPTFTDINNSFFFDDGYDFVAAKESIAQSSWAPYLVFGAVTLTVSCSLLAFAGWSRHTRRRSDIRVDTSRAPTAPVALGSATAIAERPNPRPSSPPPPMAQLVDPG